VANTFCQIQNRFAEMGQEDLSFNEEVSTMRLWAPSVPIFIISAIMAGLVIAVKYFGINVPIAGGIVKQSLFDVLLLAYIILFFGTVIRKL